MSQDLKRESQPGVVTHACNPGTPLQSLGLKECFKLMASLGYTASAQLSRSWTDDSVVRSMRRTLVALQHFNIL